MVYINLTLANQFIGFEKPSKKKNYILHLGRVEAKHFFVIWPISNWRFSRNEDPNIHSVIAHIFFECKSNEKQTPYFCRDIQSLELVRILILKTPRFSWISIKSEHLILASMMWNMKIYLTIWEREWSQFREHICILWNLTNKCTFIIILVVHIIKIIIAQFLHNRFKHCFMFSFRQPINISCWPSSKTFILSSVSH